MKKYKRTIEGINSLLMTLYINSPIKSKILKFILEKEPVTISGVQNGLKKIGDDYNYRTIWQHIKSLESDGAIISKKINHEAGKPVKIYLFPYLRKNEKDFIWFLNLALNKKSMEQFKKQNELLKKQFLKELEISKKH